MLVELWLAVTWFMYSYNPNTNMSTPMGQCNCYKCILIIDLAPLVTNSHCQPSCLVADSILTNILMEDDENLNSIRCSFLSYLFEACWDVEIAGNECRPSVDKNMRQVSQFYRQHCLSRPCFAIFSMQKGKVCSHQFQDLLQTLLNPDSCKQATTASVDNSTRDDKMMAFKSCAEHASTDSCRNETGRFIDLFMSHMQAHHRQC